MTANTYLISCNFSSFPLKNHTCLRAPSQLNHLNKPQSPFLSLKKQQQQQRPHLCYKANYLISPLFNTKCHPHLLHICHCSLETQNVQDQSAEKDVEEEEEGVNNGGSGEEERDWTTSILLFVFWGGLMYYVFFLTPDQTPSMDTYLLQKLLNLKGDDGFQVNEVLVALWYIMGLWPLVFSMLLLPTGRSSKNSVPVWPFVALSCFGGAYALIPYFVLWRPPPPPVEEAELRRWPLNFLESKLTAGITFAAGLGLFLYAGLSNGDVWKEFYQYFEGSKFDLETREKIGTGRELNGLYYLDAYSSSTSLVASSPMQIHCHLGHPSLSSLKKMVPHLTFIKDLPCESCQLGKHCRSSFVSRVDKRASSPFVLVHFDI